MPSVSNLQPYLLLFPRNHMPVLQKEAGRYPEPLRTEKLSTSVSYFLCEVPPVRFHLLARKAETWATLFHLVLLLRPVLPKPIPPLEKEASNQVFLD